MAGRPAGVDLSRRQLLGALVVSGAAAACSPAATPAPSGTASGSASSNSPSAPGITSPPPTPTPDLSPTANLPAAAPWTPRPGEVRPAVKEQATRLVEAVGTWTEAGGGGTAAVARRLAAAGFDPALARRLTALTGAGDAAVVRVRDAQYGGILASTASVLVVADQWRSMDGAARPGGTTFDIRLAAASPHWRVVEVNPAQPGRAADSLSRAARAVLADDRIRLPHAARADVAAGLVVDEVLHTLTVLAGSHVVDVSVLRSGHPLLVFGTSRPSDHPRGHAVDVWALDGRPLVVPWNHPLASAAMRAAVADGASNVGGPVQLDGPQYFSDDTHQDHIHLGFHTA